MVQCHPSRGGIDPPSPTTTHARQIERCARNRLSAITHALAAAPKTGAKRALEGRRRASRHPSTTSGARG
eukprot:425939-Pyramimonas_sp.AAC.1